MGTQFRWLKGKKTKGESKKPLHQENVEGWQI
jgi:hypothetical protein